MSPDIELCPTCKRPVGDEIRICGICGGQFSLDLAHVAWFRTRGLNLPRNCKACRKSLRNRESV